MANLVVVYIYNQVVMVLKQRKFQTLIKKRQSLSLIMRCFKEQEGQARGNAPRGFVSIFHDYSLFGKAR